MGDEEDGQVVGIFNMTRKNPDIVVHLKVEVIRSNYSIEGGGVFRMLQSRVMRCAHDSS